MLRSLRIGVACLALVLGFTSPNLQASQDAKKAGGFSTDAALAAALVARAFPDALAGLNARTYGPPGLEDDIAFCAQEDLVDVVPRLAGRLGAAAEIRS